MDYMVASLAITPLIKTFDINDFDAVLSDVHCAVTFEIDINLR